MLGMIVGFSCTAVFLISAAILIIYDEVTRHKTYDELIRRDLRKFKSSFQFNQDQMDVLEKDFQDAEEKRNRKVDATADAKELQEIN